MNRAFRFCFGGQPANINWAVMPAASATVPASLPASAPAPVRGGRGGIQINVVELKVIDGKLMYTNPGDPVNVDLGSQRGQEKQGGSGAGSD